MRVIVGLVIHESNSFNPDFTSLDQFRLLVGAEVFNQPDCYQNSSLAGIIKVFSRYGVEIIPTVVALPTSQGGIVNKEAYLRIKGLLLEQIKGIDRSYDGICLALHGSMTVEGIGDGEGDLLRAIRTMVGEQITIACALDMHAMVTAKMLASANALVSYRTAPHVDKIETGARTAEILYDSLINKYQLYTAGVEIPFLVSGEKSESAKSPMRELFGEISKTDQKPGILASSYCLGFPWVDVEFNKCSALVVSRGDRTLAEQEAKKLAVKFFEKRAEFNFTTSAYPFEEAIQIAQAAKEYPVFVIDSGDNPGAGGSQNIVNTLEYLYHAGIKDTLYCVIADQTAYQKCVEKGVNSEITLKLGRRIAGNTIIQEKLVQFTGQIKSLGSYRDLSAAVLDLNGLDLIISTRRIVLTEPEFILALGLDPRDYQIVVLKSGYLDPNFKPYARRVMLGISPGYTYQLLERLPYKNVRRPVYPLEEISVNDLKLIRWEENNE